MPDIRNMRKSPTSVKNLDQPCSQYGKSTKFSWAANVEIIDDSLPAMRSILNSCAKRARPIPYQRLHAAFRRCNLLESNRQGRVCPQGALTDFSL